MADSEACPQSLASLNRYRWSKNLVLFPVTSVFPLLTLGGVSLPGGSVFIAPVPWPFVVVQLSGQSTGSGFGAPITRWSW